MNYNELFTAKTLINIINDDSNTIKYMLDMLLTEDYFSNYNLCANLVRKNGHIIQYLPINYRTYEMYEIAINDNPAVILTMPDDLIDEAILEKAVLKDVRLLKHIPRKIMILKSKLFISLLCNNADNFESIPKEYLNKYICIIYAKKVGSFGKIPAELLTKEFYLSAVNEKIDLLEKINDVESLIYVCNNINNRETHLERITDTLLAMISLYKKIMH